MPLGELVTLLLGLLVPEPQSDDSAERLGEGVAERLGTLADCVAEVQAHAVGELQKEGVREPVVLLVLVAVPDMQGDDDAVILMEAVTLGEAVTDQLL